MVWEELVGMVENGKVKIINVVVKIYNGNKYYSATDLSAVCEVKDFESVVDTSVKSGSRLLLEVSYLAQNF